MSKIYLPTLPGCFVCGRDNDHGLQIDIYIEDGKSKVDLVADEQFRGYQDRIHGGIIFTLLDEVMGWAPAYAKKQMCVAAEITIRYLQPLPAGLHITIVGEFTADRKRIWDAKGEVIGPDNTVYAKAKGKYLPLTMEQTIEVDKNMIYPAGMKSIFRE